MKELIFLDIPLMKRAEMKLLNGCNMRRETTGEHDVT